MLRTGGAHYVGRPVGENIVKAHIGLPIASVVDAAELTVGIDLWVCPIEVFQSMREVFGFIEAIRRARCRGRRETRDALV